MTTSTLFDAIDGLVAALTAALRTSPGPDPIEVVEGRGVSDRNWRDVLFVAGDGTDSPDEDPHTVASQEWRTVGGETGDRDEDYTIGCALVCAAGEYARDISIGRRRARDVMAVIEAELRSRDAIQLGRPATTELGTGQILWAEVASMTVSYQQSAGLVRVQFGVRVRAVV